MSPIAKHTPYTIQIFRTSDILLLITMAPIISKTLRHDTTAVTTCKISRDYLVSVKETDRPVRSTHST